MPRSLPAPSGRIRRLRDLDDVGFTAEGSAPIGRIALSEGDFVKLVATSD
jgi:hypothetical protein